MLKWQGQHPAIFVVYNGSMDTAEKLDITKLRYVLYARKSTDDPKKQVRSIEDQIAECRLFAARNVLTIVGDPIIEKKSAKIPDQRPAFKQILDDIRDGKYDGILSWHPDRLARNMKEAGVIIEMLDEGVIKDLKFATHYFSNDPSGKLLLGILFTLSKHYSDKLSVDATRGTRSRLAEGKTATPKYGYINEEGIYRPDPENFDLMCQAWMMRRDGVSIEDICKFLNEKGFYRMVKSSGKKLFATKQKLSDIFRDPFYYGLLIQASQSVDLRQMYNFQPAVSEEDYNLVHNSHIEDLSQVRPTVPPPTHSGSWSSALFAIAQCESAHQEAVRVNSTCTSGATTKNVSARNEVSGQRSSLTSCTSS